MLWNCCFWPGLTRDVADYIANCPRCLGSKHPVNQRAPLVNVTTTQPMELVCIDFLSLERSRGGVENVFVVTDHITCYVEASPERIKLHELQPRSFLITTLYIMDSLCISIVSRDAISKVM